MLARGRRDGGSCSETSWSELPCEYGEFPSCEGFHVEEQTNPPPGPWCQGEDAQLQ